MSVFPKWIIFTWCANPHREVKYLIFVQFCTERGAGCEIHEASTLTIKNYSYSSISLKKGINIHYLFTSYIVL